MSIKERRSTRFNTGNYRSNSSSGKPPSWDSRSSKLRPPKEQEFLRRCKMQKDERDLLEVLKFELKFLEDGGYGRSPSARWRPQHIFEDSPTCMNFNSQEQGPCSDCVL